MDDKLLDLLAQAAEKNNVSFELSLENNVYLLKNVQISKKSNPVNKPTSRGGAYFSDYSSYRFIGTIEDTSVLPFLSKTMLGPNTEFRELKITAKPNNENLAHEITIYSYLTNTMQTSSKVELNMTITGTESS